MGGIYIKAENLEPGNVLLLPFNKEATVQDEPKVGYKFVTFKTEYGVTRVERGQEMHVKRKEVPSEAAPDTVDG